MWRTTSSYPETIEAQKQLEEDEEFNQQVAAPPKPAANKLQNIRELANTLTNAIPISKVRFSILGIISYGYRIYLLMLGF